MFCDEWMPIRLEIEICKTVTIQVSYRAQTEQWIQLICNCFKLQKENVEMIDFGKQMVNTSFEPISWYQESSAKMSKVRVLFRQ